MASQKSSSLPQPVWDSEAVLLKDFLMKYELPTVAKVTKGQFMNIGTSKFNPLKKLHQDILVHTIKTGLKVLGHSVVRMDSRDGRTHRLVPLEQRLSIPVTYKGWFELLSEDGRSVKPIDTVYQLSKMYPSVDNVLVRQNVKAYLLNEVDGKMTFDKTRVVTAGEQLKLTGDLSMQVPADFEGKVRLLKCVDTKGENVYLSFDQKGQFMPIASPTDVMGVFRIKDVIGRFRLPLTLKLVQGVWPKVDANRFTGIIRLDWAYTDETAFVCPLDRNTPRICPIPTEVNLRLLAATNNNELMDNEAFNNIMVKCNRLIANYHNTIHLIISVPQSAVKLKSHTMANLYSTANNQQEEAPRPKSQMKRSKSREDMLLEQVDDLYGYLREGRQPPIEKFARDSDEETYYEEPEFEPMTKFKSRLAMLDRGDVMGSQKNTSYNFVDPRAKLDANHNYNTMTSQKTNGHDTRPVSAAPPELPPRHYKRSDSAPFITYIRSSNGSSGSASGPLKTVAADENRTLQRRVSKESSSKNSKESNDSVDFRKSSDSKENKSSRTGSSKQLKSRKSMPLLYL